EVGAVHHGLEPLYYRFGMCDAANAMLSAIGLLAALVCRDRTGEAQELWTSLLDGGAVHASDVLLHPAGTPSWRPKGDRGQHGFGPYYRLYDTQSGWIQVAAVRPAEQAALCAAVGLEADADEAAFVIRFLTKTALQWRTLLDDAGVPNEIASDAL